jgi:hypothetical protein
MCLKIRCDGESEKFCKIFWELNRAQVNLLWLFNPYVAVLLAAFCSPAAAARCPPRCHCVVVGRRRRAESTSALAKGEETGSAALALHAGAGAGASSGDPVCYHFVWP